MLDKVTEVLNEIIQILKDEIEIVLLVAIIISSLLVVVILGKIIRTTMERRKNEQEAFNFLEGEEQQDLSGKREEKYVPAETTYIEEIVAQRLEADLPDRAKRVEQTEREEITEEKADGGEELQESVDGERIEPQDEIEESLDKEVLDKEKEPLHAEEIENISIEGKDVLLSDEAQRTFGTQKNTNWEEEIQTFFAKEEATWEEEMKKAFLAEKKEPLPEKKPMDYPEERKINSDVEKEIHFTVEKEIHPANKQEEIHNVQQPINSTTSQGNGYYDGNVVNYGGGGNLQLVLPSNIIEEISRLSARNLDEIEIKIQGAEVKLKYAGNTTLKNGNGHVYQVGENPYNEKGVQSPVMCEAHEDETKREEIAAAQGETPYDIRKGVVPDDEDLRRKRQKPGKQLLDGEQEIIQFEEMLEEMEQQRVKESQDTVDVFVKFGSDNYNTTKTGRVFTEKELEEQIRD